jgi:CHAT domain-containing protein/tetratricopeptide (TPR) repeat protein
MKRLLLGLLLAAGWCAAAGEEQPPKKLTPEERKELEAKWQELNQVGLKHYQAGKLVEATEATKQLVETARRLYPKQDHAQVAISLQSLAFMLQSRGKDADAERLLSQSLAMIRRLYPKQDHPYLAANLNGLGMALQTQSKFADAEPVFRELVALNRRRFPKQDRPELAVSLNNLAVALVGLGKDADAEPLFREGLAIYRQSYPKQDHPLVANNLNNLATAVQHQGKYANAEVIARESLAMYRRLFGNRDHPQLATTLNNLADMLQDQGKYADAESYHRQALAMRRRVSASRDHPNVAHSLRHLAGVLAHQRHFAEAETLGREALQMTRRLYSNQDHPDLAGSLNSLSGVLKEQGKYTEAKALRREALEIYRRLSGKRDHPDLADALQNLASTFQAQGQYADAELLYREALSMYQRLSSGRDHPHLAACMSNLASVLQVRKKYSAAESLQRQVLEMTRRMYPRQDHPYLAKSLNNLAGVLLDQGQYRDAESLYREALVVNRRLHSRWDHPSLAVNLSNLAEALRALEQYADAEPLYREALAMALALARAYAAEGSEGNALTFSSTGPPARDGFLANARRKKTTPVTVYSEVWSSKAAITRVSERRALAARAAAADRKVVALLDQITDRRRQRADLLLATIPTDVATCKERDADLTRYTREIEALDRALRPLLPSVERSDKLTDASPADLQQVLPVDAAVVDVLRYTRSEYNPKKPGNEGWEQTVCYLAFVLTRDQVAWLDLGPAQPLEDAVTAWRAAIISGKEIKPELPARVRDLAWAKVRQEIPRGVKVVYISPDAALCRVPWAALPGDRPDTILLEDYAVAVVPHPVFLLDKLWPQERLAKRPSDVLAVGGVAYDTEPSSGPLADNRGEPLLKPGQKLQWPALPGAAGEAQGVIGAAAKKKLVTHTLDSDKATTSAVLAALPQARYAHLATHGFFADASFRSVFRLDPDLFQQTQRGERVGAGALSPMVMTGLVFAGANKPGTPGRGVVTGEALVDLNLSGLELAVLSACETGLGDVADGEGTFGLQRAFHLAGTRDVIASLWKVSDQATAALMALFYQNLWDKNLPPIESLRRAQLEIYRHPDKIPELAKAFRGKFVEVTGSADEVVKSGRDGRAPPRLWAAFTLSGPGR